MGFVVNYVKSDLVPRQLAVYIGYLIHSIAMRISLPHDKLARISSFANDLFARKHCSVRVFARMIGWIVSFFKAISPARSHHRAMERLKLSALAANNNDLDADVVFTPGALHGLRWWATIAHCHNGVSIKKPNDHLYYYRCIQH